jgi:hypothetical protein
MKVNEIMHGGVTWVSPSTPLVELAKKRLRSGREIRNATGRLGDGAILTRDESRAAAADFTFATSAISGPSL